jgi:hypothetical protein
MQATSGRAQGQLLRKVFERSEQAHIAYCLLRDHDQIVQGNPLGEVDLLIQKSQRKQLIDLLADLSFVALPSWGYAPHHFFVAYDEQADGWIKLDVVTELAFGKPVPSISTDLATACLKHRQRTELAYVPAPEAELVALLLHCVLDKGVFTPPRRQRLLALRQAVRDQAYLTELLRSYWLPTASWPQLAAVIDAAGWTTLLAQRASVSRHLTRKHPIATSGRTLTMRVLRKLNRWSYVLRPGTPLVALLAPDGAGKSTLVANLQQSFYFPMHSIYMGLYQRKQVQRRPRMIGAGFIGRLFTQWQRYLSAQYHRARGRFVIFDRYPYDALLQPNRRLNWIKRSSRWLMAHACPAPDLVLLLDAPGDVLYARKGEHSPAFLEQQRQNYLALKASLPQMVIVNAMHDSDKVRREATALIWRTYAQHVQRRAFA